MTTGNEGNQPSDIDSVESAMQGQTQVPVWFLRLNEQESASVKCSKCNEITAHQIFKVEPQPNPHNFPPAASDPMFILGLSKRLKMCTICANVQLTK